MRRTTLVAILALAVMAAVIFWLFGGKNQEAIPYTQPEAWMPEVASGKDPVFVREGSVSQDSTSPEDPLARALVVSDLDLVAKGESLGQLEGEELRFVQNAADRQLTFLGKKLEAHQQQMDASVPEDLEKEAHLLVRKELAAVAAWAFRTGHYVVVPQRTADLLVPPEGYARQTIGCTKGGSAAVALVLVSYSRNAGLLQARDYQEQARAWRISETARKFNELPYGVRRARIERYLEVKGKPNPTESDMEFLSLTVPRGLGVDASRALLYVIE